MAGCLILRLSLDGYLAYKKVILVGLLMKRPRAVIFDRDDTGMAMNDALSGRSEILKAEKSLASKERIQITLEGEDASRLIRLSNFLGGYDKAVSFSLGLCLVALGIHRLNVSQPSKPLSQTRLREPSLKG